MLCEFLQIPGSLPIPKALNLIKFIDRALTEQNVRIKAFSRTQDNLVAVLSSHSETTRNFVISTDFDALAHVANVEVGSTVSVDGVHDVPRPKPVSLSERNV